MQKSTTAVSILTAGVMLLGNALAQQTPAPAPATAAKTTSAPAKKPAAKPAAKSAAAPLVLKTQKEKASYAIGLNLGSNIGKSLHQDSVDIDPNILARGLKDGLAGNKPLLTNADMQATMTALSAEVKKRKEDKLQKESAVSIQAGTAFLAANKSKEGVVVLPSGLQYKVLTAGTGPKPTASDSVVCNYKGTFVDGTEFDSSYKGGKSEPITFAVTGVIKGWTEALQLMPVGSKWQLVIPSDLAYGPSGRPGIPPSSTLVFEVELLSIQDKSADKDTKDDKK
jgi:FKBP-type peptidyl-prolyl cis-trans isomerase FklB